MKFPLRWHKEGLENSRRYLQEKIDKLNRMKEQIELMRKKINFTDAQIIEAELRGVTEFDPDKFGIKKAAK